MPLVISFRPPARLLYYLRRITVKFDDTDGITFGRRTMTEVKHLFYIGCFHHLFLLSVFQNISRLAVEHLTNGFEGRETNGFCLTRL